MTNTQEPSIDLALDSMLAAVAGLYSFERAMRRASTETLERLFGDDVSARYEGAVWPILQATLAPFGEEQSVYRGWILSDIYRPGMIQTANQCLGREPKPPPTEAPLLWVDRAHRFRTQHLTAPEFLYHIYGEWTGRNVMLRHEILHLDKALMRAVDRYFEEYPEPPRALFVKTKTELSALENPLSAQDLATVRRQYWAHVAGKKNL